MIYKVILLSKDLVVIEVEHIYNGIANDALFRPLTKQESLKSCTFI